MLTSSLSNDRQFVIRKQISDYSKKLFNQGLSRYKDLPKDP